MSNERKECKPLDYKVLQIEFDIFMTYVEIPEKLIMTERMHQAHQQIRQLITQQQLKIDEGYIKKNIVRMREIFSLNKGQYYSLIRDCKDFITQIINDVKGK